LITGGLSKRAVEELVVEGNILLKATDMDINLGPNIDVEQEIRWLERPLFSYLARDLPNLGAIFDIGYLHDKLVRRTATRGSHTVINRIRDRYMRDIYQAAAVNLSHLASSIIVALAEQGITQIAERRFRETLYLSIKHLQAHPDVRLHRGLVDPARYQPVLYAAPSALTEFLDSAQSVQLIERDGVSLELKDKLLKEHTFDEIRLENPIEVYANEVEPLVPVGQAVRSALIRAETLSAVELAREWFDDELKALKWDRSLYSARKHYDINSRETATADPEPFLFEPAQAKEMGIVLVHGFLASPAEVREFGQKLHDHGYITLGVRLKGHGTSPWDLRERTWRDWLESIERGRAIMSELARRYVVIGFSTGGTLSLISAAEQPEGIAGVVALGAPLKFRNKNLRFVPLMHGANRIMNWLSSYEGVMPFRPNESEHPHINYRHIPLRGLYELTRVASHLNGVLDEVRCPVCLLQATGDRVVDPVSASIAYDKLGSVHKELHWIESNRHGILNEDIGETHSRVLDFLIRMESAARSGLTP
jgi:esterase/lipase